MRHRQNGNNAHARFLRQIHGIKWRWNRSGRSKL